MNVFRKPSSRKIASVGSSKRRPPRQLAVEMLEDRSLLSAAPHVSAVLGDAPGVTAALVGSPRAGQTLVTTHTAVSASTLAALPYQAVTFTATVTSTTPSSSLAGGTVDFYNNLTKIGSATVDSSGHAAFTTSSLGVGSYRISAAYQGNATFRRSSSPTACAVIVRQDFPTSTDLSVTATRTYGQLATLTATVKALNPNAGIPAGTVTFSDGQTVLGTATLDSTGKATLSGVKLPAGSHVLVAGYQGANQFGSSSSPRCLRQVARAATAVALVSSLPTATHGQSVTFTATVTSSASGAGTPTGSVAFYDGTTLLGTIQLNGSGVATFSTTTLIVGSHSIHAYYVLSQNFLNSGATVVQRVLAGP